MKFISRTFVIASLLFAFGSTAGAQTGRVSGTVTDGTSGIPNVDVDIWDLDGLYRTEAETDATGYYITEAVLGAGNYYATTRNDSGYIDELFNNFPCPASACDPTRGTPISVTDGNTTSGIDFVLELGGGISGQITNSDAIPAGIEGVEVWIYDAAGAWITTVFSDSSGNYALPTVLPSGSYYVATFNELGYKDELYDDIPCPPSTCDILGGDEVVVTKPAVTASINFQLTKGGGVSGQVTDGVSGVQGIDVLVYDSTGLSSRRATTDVSGNYTLTGLETGTHYARTFNTLGYIDERYQELTCSTESCDILSGNEISVTDPNVTVDINFTLALGGNISGRITDASSPTTGLGDVVISVYDTSGVLVASATSIWEEGNEGYYIVPGGLEAGNYTAKAVGSNYIGELHSNISCPAGLCSLTGATPIPVVAGATTTVDFGLMTGGRISGTITDLQTAAPLSGIQVNIWDSVGNPAGTATTDGSGKYELLTGLPSSTAYYATTSNILNYSDQLYGNLPCLNGTCTPTTGTPITVLTGTTTKNIDFALALFGGSIKVAKETLPDLDPTTFNFTGAITATLSDGQASVEVPVAPGQHKVSEALPMEWNVSIVCDDADSFSNGNEVTFVVEAQESVSCTFTNTKKSAIRVVKETLPAADPQTFEFSGQLSATLGDGGTSMLEVTPGQYTVSETVPAGWDLTSIVCDDGNSSGDINTSAATFDVAFGEIVTCTFTNTKRGSIRVEKQTLPDGDPTLFSFSGAVTGNFDLMDEQMSDLVEVKPGQYTVLETLPVDWELLEITCNDGNSSGSGRTATFNVDPGEAVICTFTNQSISHSFIRVTKETLPDQAPEMFNFTGAITALLGDGQVSSAVEVTPGQYQVAETVPADWRVLGINCDDANSTGSGNTATYNVEMGETVTCTFTNATRSNIRLDKSSLVFNATSNRSIITSSQTVLVNIDGYSGIDWSASANQPWVQVSPLNGTGKGSLDVSVNLGLVPLGPWSATISVTSPDALNSPQTVNVTGTAFAPGSTSGPFGSFDTPFDQTTGITGAIAVTGWALDDIEVTGVQIWRDPVVGEPGALYLVGDAVFVEGARPDVEALYPQSPLSYRAGWGYMMLTYGLPNQGNGPYVLHAYATDKEGNQVLLGSKSITCDNVNAAKPFGTIDTPAQGGSISGVYPNWGWVLTPQPNNMTDSPALIQVYVDSVMAGTLEYGFYRDDIFLYFPGYADTSKAVGRYYLDTTAYENGVHTIGWYAVDNAGRADGIGSRFFIIQNTGSTPDPPPGEEGEQP